MSDMSPIALVFAETTGGTSAAAWIQIAPMNGNDRRRSAADAPEGKHSARGEYEVGKPRGDHGRKGAAPAKGKA